VSVRPGGAPLCYYVTSSRAGHDPHQVNLGAHRGNGDCDCEHFVYRLRDAAEHAPAASDETRCRHIREAREFLLDELIRRLSQPQPQRQ
jgi:hypothetical protein